jgi:hypothetical protein
MRGAIPPFPEHPSMAWCKGTTLAIPFYLYTSVNMFPHSAEIKLCNFLTFTPTKRRVKVEITQNRELTLRQCAGWLGLSHTLLAGRVCSIDGMTKTYPSALRSPYNRHGLPRE